MYSVTAYGYCNNILRYALLVFGNKKIKKEGISRHLSLSFTYTALYLQSLDLLSALKS